MKTAKDLELLLLVKEKKIQDLNLEIERLKEEYMILQNASDEVEEEKDKEIERLKNQSNNYAKRIINALNYIRDNINFRLSKKFIEEIYDILEGVNING